MTDFTCPYCETVKTMSASRARLNRTCGEQTCRERYLAERGHGNKGRRHSDEINKSKGDHIRGQRQSPEHIAARTKARLEAGWFQAPDIGERISAGKIAAEWSGLRGPDNPNWQGGIAAENQRGRGGKAYATWRQAVITRDDYTCQQCGIRESLVAHHLKGWVSDRNLRFELSNGITLCESCHSIVHNHASYPRRSRVKAPD